jgi:hypothetical protein
MQDMNEKLPVLVRAGGGGAREIGGYCTPQGAGARESEYMEGHRWVQLQPDIFPGTQESNKVNRTAFFIAI